MQFAFVKRIADPSNPFSMLTPVKYVPEKRAAAVYLGRVLACCLDPALF